MLLCAVVLEWPYSKSESPKIKVDRFLKILRCFIATEVIENLNIIRLSCWKVGMYSRRRFSFNKSH